MGNRNGRRRRLRLEHFVPYRLSVLTNIVSTAIAGAYASAIRAVDSGMARDRCAGPRAGAFGSAGCGAHGDGQGRREPRGFEPAAIAAHRARVRERGSAPLGAEALTRSGESVYWRVVPFARRYERDLLANLSNDRTSAPRSVALTPASTGPSCLARFRWSRQMPILQRTMRAGLPHTSVIIARRFRPPGVKPMNTRLQPAGPTPVRKSDETAVRTVAEFEIKHHQLLDPNGRLTGALPEFARDPAELAAHVPANDCSCAPSTPRPVNLQRTGKLGTYASCLGHEATHVGAGAAMRPEDVLVPVYREIRHAVLAWREDVGRAALLGRR